MARPRPSSIRRLLCRAGMAQNPRPICFTSCQRRRRLVRIWHRPHDAAVGNACTKGSSRAMSLSLRHLRTVAPAPPLLIALSALLLSTGVSAGQTAVTTYHYDTNRTGWNQHETVLTPANVGSTSFGFLHHVALDDQVDGQPLIVPGVTITAGTHQGKHDAVYVATEGNTIYAIDT